MAACEEINEKRRKQTLLLHLEAVVVVADCEFEVINNTEISRSFNWTKCILSNLFGSGNLEAVLLMYSH